MHRFRCAALLLTLSAALAAPAPAAPAPADTGPVAHVSIRSADDLLADFRYLAPLVGQEMLPDQLDGLMTLTGVRKLDGVDRKKPFGVYVLWPEKVAKPEDLGPTPVVFAPISDERAFLGLLKKVGVTLERIRGETYRVTMADQSVVLRFANGHAHVTTDASRLPEKLPDPATFRPGGGQKGILFASVRPDRIPKEHLKVLKPLFETIEAAAALAAGKANAAQTRSLVQGTRDAVEALLTGTREVTLGLEVDHKQHEMTLEVIVSPTAEGGIAEFAKNTTGTHSHFAALVSNSDLGGVFHLPPLEKGADAEKQRKEIENRVKEIATVAGGFVEDRYRDAVLEGMEIWMSTLVVDGMDLGLMLRTGAKLEDTTFIAGLKVQKGDDLRKLVQKVYRDLPENEKNGFVLGPNPETYGKARIHSVKFEGTEGALAFRDDVVFLGIGTLGRKAVKESLDSFGKDKPAPSPLFSAQLAGPLLRLNQDIADLLDKEVPRGERDRVGARLTVEGGKDIRLRLRMSTHLLRLVKLLNGSAGQSR